MEGDSFSTPTSNASRFTSSFSRSRMSKRDSLAAELERDPQTSSAKRQQRSQAFTSHLAHASLERQLVAAQTAKADLETKVREKDVQIERLEGDRRWLSEREKEEREEKEKERDERAEDKRKADTELRSLRNALMVLREQHADLEDEHSTLSRSTSQTITAQKSQISTLTRQLSVIEEELAEYKRIAEERSSAFEELQAQLDDVSAAQDSFVQKEEEEENWAIVREELHRQAEYMRGLEATNAKMSAELAVLRERHTSAEVLKEQKRDLERKVAAAEHLREKVVLLEAGLDAARHERERWAAETAGPSTPSKTPVSVTQNLSNLRLEHARLLEEHGSTRALLRRREVELADAERRSNETEEVLEKVQADIRAVKKRVGRVEHDKILAEREVTFLRAMVASFTAEEASQNGFKLEEATVQRVQELEGLLSEYKETVKNLEEELEQIGVDPKSAVGINSVKQMQEELAREKTAKIQAEKDLADAEATSEKQLEQIDNLEQILFELQGEIGGGRHLPPGTRVLSLKDNPAQQWVDLSQAAMDRLKGENEALLKRLKQLEESGVRGIGQNTPSEELVPRESWEVVNREKTRLEQELKQKEKRLLRLQQIFHAKSTEFRQVIASILGVKLAFYPNGQVRVTSRFDLGAAFVFQPTGGSGSRGSSNDKEDSAMKMQLIAQGEGGPEDLPQLMRYWVEQEQCIPGFVASVTLECYEKWRSLGKPAFDE